MKAFFDKIRTYLQVKKVGRIKRKRVSTFKKASISFEKDAANYCCNINKKNKRRK